VSTREIFAFALTGRSKRMTIPPFFAGQGANDLEPVVVARYPEVAAPLAWLRSRCPQARMTGSGACLFAEFASEADAAAVHAELPAGTSGFVARGLERHPLCGWVTCRPGAPPRVLRPRNLTAAWAGSDPYLAG